MVAKLRTGRSIGVRVSDMSTSVPSPVLGHAEEAVQHIRAGLNDYLEAGFEPIGPNDAVAAIREMRDELPDE